MNDPEAFSLFRHIACMTKTNRYAGKVKNNSAILRRLDERDPVFTFNRVMEGINIEQYLAYPDKKRSGRPGYNRVDMLKTVLFAFMETGYVSLRELEDRCKANIRYIYLMKGKTPCYRSFGYFIKNVLGASVEEIFLAVMQYIRESEGVDMQHVYIDGSKFEANANKYTWVWKKATEKSRFRLYGKITVLFEEINMSLSPETEPFPVNTEYSPEALDSAVERYASICNIDESLFVHGRGHRKTPVQRFYEKLCIYRDKLREYAVKMRICGKDRNSYSKSDHDATFMRIKTDYMGNDQLLPAYNIQFCVADEYIVTAGVYQYRSDMDCFAPLMDKFESLYGFYPKYPVADAGYGSFNNYIFCEQHGMEKYMKFPMFKKETGDASYRDNSFRAVNFKTDPDGSLICPNGMHLRFAYRKAVRGNLYGRQEEVFICEDCSDCPFASQCKKTDKNRSVRINQELSAIHQEVIENLESIQGCLLRMNRSIQAEGVFGITKQDRGYRRIRRKGMKSVYLELVLVSIGFNLYKYHNKQKRNDKTA